MIRSLTACLILLLSIHLSLGQTRIQTIAVLDPGQSPVAQKSLETIRQSLLTAGFEVMDQDLVRSAARGIGYAGSLNLEVNEARELGAAIASDFLILTDAQTLRRTSSQMPVYFEAYCSVFIVSSRTGQLIHWERPSFTDVTGATAEQLLLRQLATKESLQRWVSAIKSGEDRERAERSIIEDSAVPVIEAPEDEKQAAAKGFQLPRPYRRFRPDYPDSASRADVEATVDVMVDVATDGEISRVQIARWAGFGLDEATMTTVKRLHFFPAKQDGTPVAMRVLLRYNFRRTQSTQ